MLPTDTAQRFQIEDLVEFVCGPGLGIQLSENTAEQLREIIKLARWYSTAKVNPSEYETISYLINPFLRLLGWPQQQLAIEWQDIDVALFSGLPRCNDNLTAILEAKRRGRSCLHALPQAISYTKNRPNCRRLILTDGTRYWVYVKRSDAFTCYAHLDLNRLRAAYPVYLCAGAKEALQAMTPVRTDCHV